MSADAANPGQSYESSRSRDPDEIESEIERTRADLGRTIDALHHRLSPRERLAEAADSLRAGGRRAARAAADSVTPSITGQIRLDHTHVLALLRRFRPWTSAGRKQALVENACLALEVHAQLEEEIFYPAVRQIPGPKEVLDRSKPEHDEMRKLIGRIRSMQVDDVQYDETFHDLMRAVLHHVADEETVLLPLAETHLRAQLGELGRQMTARRMQLLGPHLGAVTTTAARSFPLLTIAAMGALAGALWILSRPVRANFRARDWT